MFWKRWMQSQRGLLVLFSITIAVPLATLFWLGWRLLQQDQVLEAQQTRQRVERAGDIVAAALARAVETSTHRFVEAGEALPAGAVTVTAVDGGAVIRPAERVAWVPAAPRLPEPPDAPFAAGEELEFRQGDFTRAAGIYRELARSKDAAVRTGALLRMARSLRRANRPQEALSAYSTLLNVDGFAFQGMPAGLIARHSRCLLIEPLQQSSGLRDEAMALGADLRRGRWPLIRPIQQFYAGEAARWGVPPAKDDAEREFLAEAADALWRNWPAAGLTGARSELLDIGGRKLAVVWGRSQGRVSALLATDQFVAEQWLPAVASQLSEQRVTLALGSPLPAGVVRRAAATALPWDVWFASQSPAPERSQFELRRRLLLAGFVVLVLLAALASYSIFRAMGRELAVARLQSDFVAAVSHEFRTPLTSLRQFIDVLREHKNLTEERRNLCYEAQSRATDRLTRLVESLLDFGRMEGGARHYHLERHDCAELVRRVVGEFRGEAKPAGFEVRLTENGAAGIDADPEALGRALWNLLDNAVKYSGDGRTVDVTVERRDAGVAISVRDRGIGIPAGDQALVFRKFHRSEEVRELGIKGTGIGLAMVDHIVRAHRGRVELESEPGKGSTFTIVLPLGG